MSNKYLIVGLGNPGHQYASTRHNVGFFVIDELARRHNITNFTSERKALTADGIIGGKRVILAKPQTYMNLSGESVRTLVDYYNIDINNIIVIHDDLDLSLGTLRIRTTGGHGGQNGVRNIILHLGTKEFARARFGIGRPPGRMKASDYVLQKFIEDEKILAEQVLETSANAVEVWLKEGIETAMSQFNGDVNDSGTKGNSKPDLKAQIKVAERAHELNPKDPKPLRELTKLYKKNKQLDEAARAHLELSEISRENGDMAQTIREMEQAVRVRPMLIEVREEIARLYEERDNKKRAVQTWLGLAVYYEKQADMQSALKAINQALRVNPQHPKAIELQDDFRKKITM